MTAWKSSSKIASSLLASPLACKWSNYLAQSDRALWRSRRSGSVRSVTSRARELRQQDGNRSTAPDNSTKLRQIIRPNTATYREHLQRRGASIVGWIGPPFRTLGSLWPVV